ncbi:MAG: hypothetical protein RLZZ577_52 [Bacteroidota bacterium]|jgi:hypothetical protein
MKSIKFENERVKKEAKLLKQIKTKKELKGDKNK